MTHGSFCKRLLVIAAAVVALAGCTKDNTEIMGPAAPGGTTDANTAVFGLTVPGMKTPAASTRALTEAQEKAVREVDVLIVGSAGTLLEWHRKVGTEITTVTGDDAKDYTFRVEGVENPSNITVVLVANAGVEVAAALDAVAGSGSWVGADKKAFLTALQMAATTKWNADGAAAGDAWWRLPMYGETSVANIYAATGVPVIDLVRMHAKVDVIVGDDAKTDFTLGAVHVVNYNTRGYVAPTWNATTGVVQTGTAIATNLPADAGLALWVDGNELTYTASSASMESEIYLFESNALYSATDNPEAENPTVPEGKLRLVVEGTYDGATYFYPVDFTYDDDDSKESLYMPVLRNHRYVFTITEASGRGYTSLADAVASHTVVSNLRYRIIWYDEGLVRDIVFDGQYMLGVDEKERSITREKQDIAMAVFADNPAGWTASIDNPTGAGAWLRFTDGAIPATLTTTASGVPSVKNFTLTAALNETGATRTATITITAGRLTMTVTVKQTATSGYAIRITDVDGNEITQLTFGYALTEPTIPAQKFFVAWEGPDACSVERTTEVGATAFEYATDSDQPGTSDGGTITGLAAGYTIQTVDGDYTATRRSKVTFTLADGAGNTISRDLALVQAETVTEAQIAPPTGMGFTYVGAFWKAAETGERVIRIRNLAETYAGGFGVRMFSHGGFAEGDIVFDDKAYDTYPLPGDAEANPVAGTAQIYGTVGSTGGDIAFRIGLGSQLAGGDATAAPRYASAAIFYKLDGKTQMQRLWLRQGEADDYVMKPGDAGLTTAAAAGRPIAQRFSVFNLTTPNRDATSTFVTTGYDTNVATAGGETTDYPTKAGALWQFASANARYAYNPVAPSTLSGGTTVWNTTNNNSLFNATHETCPPGYRRPVAAYNTPVDNEFYQSLIATEGVRTDAANTNFAWGYYADGYFDRGDIVQGLGLNGGAYSAVNASDIGAGYAGRVYFNPTGNASLFFPAVGYRNYGSGGPVSYTGASGFYWSSSAYTYSGNTRQSVTLYFNSTRTGEGYNETALAAPIRCVVDPDYVAPTYIAERFAKSNIVMYVDAATGNKILTFAETTDDHTVNKSVTPKAGGTYTVPMIPANAQGLHFRWGSLVGVTGDGTEGAAFNSTIDETVSATPINSSVVFWPAEYRASSNWPTGTWIYDRSTTGVRQVPYATSTDIDANPTSGEAGYGMDAFLNWGDDEKGYKKAEAKGDICRYISDMGWTTERWRMPTTAEINELRTETTASAMGNVNGVILPSSGGWSTPYETIDGTGVLDGAGYKYGYHTMNSVRIVGGGVTAGSTITNPGFGAIVMPASGIRDANLTGTGQLIYPGTNAAYWSATPNTSTTNAYNLLYYDATITTEGGNYRRTNGMSIRCIRE